MYRSTFLLIILGCLLTACETTPKDSSVASFQDGDSAQADVINANSKKSSSLSEGELESWNDPSFQKEFTASYIAETKIEPPVSSQEREQMQEVLELISSDQMDQAAALLESSRGVKASAVFDFTLANIYFQREQYEKAAANYRTAVDKYPKFRRAWRNLGIIHVRQGDFKKALPALTQVVELEGDDALTYGLMGYSYSNVGNNTSAESAYRMAILLDPETLDWKMGLARSLFKQQRYAEAVDFLGNLIDENPDRADLWLLQANAYIGFDKPLKAAENYELVDRLGESTVDSLNMLADIYINEGLFELAVETYIHAMQKAPLDKPDRAIRAANVLAGRSAHEQTNRLVDFIESEYSDQITTEQRTDLLKLRARLAVAEGATDEQAKVLKEIVEIDPLDGEALILLGQHHSRKGDTEQATFYYQRAAGIEQYEADAKIRHAQLLVKNGKYTDALPLLRSAQQIKPRDNIQKYLEEVERVAKAR